MVAKQIDPDSGVIWNRSKNKGKRKIVGQLLITKPMDLWPLVCGPMEFGLWTDLWTDGLKLRALLPLILTKRYYFLYSQMMDDDSFGLDRSF